MVTHPGKLLVISGPTAVGKGTVVEEVLEQDPNIVLSISATTRGPRPQEVDGKNYFFLTTAEFQGLIENNELLEYALVHQTNYYGTPKKPVEDALNSGKNVILEIDIQGAFQVKENFPEAVLVFLQPPSWEELVRRLQKRGTESSEEQQNRLRTAKLELAQADKFDVQITNVYIEQAAQEILQLF